MLFAHREIRVKHWFNKINARTKCKKYIKSNFFIPETLQEIFENFQDILGVMTLPLCVIHEQVRKLTKGVASIKFFDS